MKKTVRWHDFYDNIKQRLMKRREEKKTMPSAATQSDYRKPRSNNSTSLEEKKIEECIDEIKERKRKKNKENRRQ